MNRQEYERALLSKTITAITAHPRGAHVCSILLAGSFSRGEPSYLPDETGRSVLRSDIELAVVYTGSPWLMRSFISDLSGSVPPAVNLLLLRRRRVVRGHNFNFQLSTPRLKTLFTLDLYRTGRTLWGEELLASHRHTPFRLDPFEGRRIVANRIGELALMMSRDAEAPLLLQWQCKLALAIIRGWMVTRGCQLTGDMDILAESERLDSELAACFGKPFIELYRSACLYLRREGERPVISDDLMREAVARFDRLCRIRAILRSHTTCLSRRGKYTLHALKAGRLLPFPGMERFIIDGLFLSYATHADDLAHYAVLWKNILY